MTHTEPERHHHGGVDTTGDHNEGAQPASALDQIGRPAAHGCHHREHGEQQWQPTDQRLRNEGNGRRRGAIAEAENERSGPLANMNSHGRRASGVA